MCTYILYPGVWFWGGGASHIVLGHSFCYSFQSTSAYTRCVRLSVAQEGGQGMPCHLFCAYRSAGLSGGEWLAHDCQFRSGGA